MRHRDSRSLQSRFYWSTHHASTLIPSISLSYDLHQVYQSEQHWHLDQRTDRGRQSLITIRAKSSHRNGDRQLKIIARRRETLRGGQRVREPKTTGDPQRGKEYDEEIHNQRRSHPYDRHNLMNDLAALGGKEDENGVEQPNQRPRRGEAQKDALVPLGATQTAERESGDDGRAERDAQEYGDAGGHD